jgi:hypothetical protein
MVKRSWKINAIFINVEFKSLIYLLYLHTVEQNAWLRFRLTNRDDYFESHATTFKAALFFRVDRTVVLAQT